jgi:RNA-directed DNA polymerase
VADPAEAVVPRDVGEGGDPRVVSPSQLPNPRTASSSLSTVDGASVVYTFIADRPVRQLKERIRALTNRTSQQKPAVVMTRLNQIMRGWANYFKHAVCKHTMRTLEYFVWRRVVKWWRTLHRWSGTEVRRWLFNPATGRWNRPVVEGIELFNLAAVPITRCRYRGVAKIPSPWPLHNHV